MAGKKHFFQKERFTKEIIDMLRNNLVKNGDPQKGIIRKEAGNRRRVHFISQIYIAKKI
jgi:hypothetical protein